MSKQKGKQTMKDTETDETEEIIKNFPIPHQIASRVAIMCSEEELSTEESLEIVCAHLAMLMNLIEEADVSIRDKREEFLRGMLSYIGKGTLDILVHSDSTKIWSKECH